MEKSTLGNCTKCNNEIILMATSDREGNFYCESCAYILRMIDKYYTEDGRWGYQSREITIRQRIALEK